MASWLREQLARRPAWMNALLAFSVFMAVVYVPWDFLCKPVSYDVEVWLGVALHGWAAKATEPLHWALYAAGAYGLWRMRPWMWPWASLYSAQVALGMLVWSVHVRGGAFGWLGGLVAALPFAALSAALWRAREDFGRRPRRLRERYGEWALVTGASAGIGGELARALAAEGLSLVLVARREERLRALATELEREHGVATRVVAADLGAPGGAEQLADALSGLEIALLVNNAGFGYAGRFDRQETRRLCEMVQLNCVTPVVLTSRLLPAMRERGRGAVIFTGSVSGRQPLPLHALYSATKAFDLFLGEALWAELRGSGVDVLVLEPGSTETEFQQVAREVPHSGADAREVAQAALDALGRQPSVIPGWFDWLRANAAQRLGPRSVVALLAKRVMEAQTPPEMR